MTIAAPAIAPPAVLVTVPAIHPKLGIRAKSCTVVWFAVTAMFDCDLLTNSSADAVTVYVPSGTDRENFPTVSVPWLYPPGRARRAAPTRGDPLDASVTVPLIHPTPAAGRSVTLTSTNDEVFVHNPSKTARLMLYSPAEDHRWDAESSVTAVVD